MKKSEKTKRQLASVLKELMVLKPLEKISIQEVMEKAQLNRQTFYYHFEDIYDLLKWTLEREAIELLDDYKDESLWQEGYRDILLYLEKNRAFALNAINSMGHEHFNRFFHQEIYSIIEDFVKQIAEMCQEVEKKYMSFVTHFFTVSITAVTISWLQGELDFSVEELIQMVDRFLSDHLEGTKTLYGVNNTSCLKAIDI
ncbi:TetR/AcrR family transcriptional regulator C-terminal domain-containing protein [Lysinibacillus sp. OL1_EC]|uniref:TetR/AcrR family transcriptional regulator C-terminal domain-containing protein n=1 Tax=unclassified Lysinibacillus TaxID=2636778 RepID=UPI00103E1E9C|nr:MULTISPECIES: TetR/AcrR family transcriptional regulator C-terminal domain-containing protein [unclassified Lysinibacillus]MCM0622959.1 TetR/AcrR family transcriptional regulator C-terminal domain-containing protein [Lysinibacillus sp. OL1_EC]MCS5499651.1 TetR/AcrR family transcriptional regulator C-terminal domain-containing protein [Lysinibacillus sp. A4]TBV90111.1 TetR family transcriptional regulator [Lysinibacillus sp. OL1]WGT41528.1 TetR/AcrR family transcriptional regulator C-terminal